MSPQRIVACIAGLSLGALLIAAGGLHAGLPGAVAPVTATATTVPTGRITGEPVTRPFAPGTPPAPSPLAPLPPPTGERVAPRAEPGDRAGASAVDVSVRAAITAGAIAAPMAPPPPRSSDVVDDSRPITESVFDKEDLIDHHPVDSDGPITESVFDKEDLVDHHPVP
jgi:hypothetical protein